MLTAPTFEFHGWPRSRPSSDLNRFSKRRRPQTEPSGGTIRRQTVEESPGRGQRTPAACSNERNVAVPQTRGLTDTPVIDFSRNTNTENDRWPVSVEFNNERKNG